GTAAKPPGGWEVSGTAAKPPGGLEVSGTAAKPPGGQDTPWSDLPADPPEPKPAPGMRPGLLTELLGEEKEADVAEAAEPEPVPQLLRADSGGRTAEAPWRQETASAQQTETSLVKSATQAREEHKPAGFACPSCDFIAKSAAGLASHRRRHA
ncbi:MAG: hypothetical protein ABR592_14250, partial [Nitriliruptorales bacterium]